MTEIEDELSLIAEKVHNPLSVEDLLQDSVTETAFPSIRRMLKIYVLIPVSETIGVFPCVRNIEEFFQNGTITKKCTAPDDNSLEMSLLISYNKTPLNTNDVKESLTNGRKRKITGYFQTSFSHNNKIVLLNSSVS